MGNTAGNEGGQSGTGAMPGNVLQLRDQPWQVTPPADWVSEWASCVLRCDATDAGRLVRLADVVRWLMVSRELPRINAVQAVYESLTQEVYPALYWLNRDGYATPLPADSMWSFHTDAQVESERAGRLQKALQQQHEDKQSSFLPGFPAWRTAPLRRAQKAAAPDGAAYMPPEPGMPALLRRIQLEWTEAPRKAGNDNLTRIRSRLSPLAITLNMAHSLWGYGVAVTAPALSAAMAPADAGEWTGERLQAEQAAIRASGAKDFTQQLAKKTGLSPREITRRIAAAKATGPQAASSVFNMAKKTTRSK